MKKTKLMALVLSVFMVIPVLPVNVLATPSAVTVVETVEESVTVETGKEIAELASTPVTDEYVRVHSLAEIVPNQRYIIVGSYYNETTGETSYHAMGTQNYRNNGFRYSYAQDQDGTHYFDMSADKEEITVYSYPEANHDPILRLRLRPYTYKFPGHAYYLMADNVEGGGYLCGYSSSTSDGSNGHHYHSSMPIYASSYNTAGSAWWYLRVVEDGDYAGHWQVVNRCKFRTGGSSTYQYDVMTMGAPYPNIGGQFRATVAYTEDVGEIDDEERVQYTVDKQTNIWLYREVCDHDSSNVTHKEATPATCTYAGNPEYWYCAGCETYFSKSDFSAKISVADTFIAPLPHDESCSHAEQAKFELYKESSMESDQTGERYLLVGKSGGKYYAMGNVTNSNGTRNAVEVSISEYGIITATSDKAEFLVYDFDENGFKDDGNYFSAIDGKIIAYAHELVGVNGYIPHPASFRQDSYDTGAGAFLAWSTFDTDNEYIVFDEENLVFKAQSEELNNTYRYRELCPHEKVYTPAVDATCTEQGVVENWYCETCYKYFADEEGEVPLLDEYEGPEALTLNATGHDFGEDDICKNCGMKRHVYSQISSLTEFDALSDNASYIIVFKDADKTYAACLPASDGFPCDTDSDGDGIVDDLETDENENTVPDCIEWLFDNWGMGDMNGYDVVDIIDYNEFVRDRDEDGYVDFDDYVLFYEENYFNFRMRYEEEAMQLDNFVEVTPKEDGTIVITDEGAMEFQLMQAGVWGGAPYNEEYLKIDLEEAGFSPEAVRIRAAWVPNMWVGNSGRMGAYEKEHFTTSYRVYGDFEYPGIVDMKNWKVSFNKDGTAVLVATWSYYDDTGALRLVKFVNENEQEDMTIVALPEAEWEYSSIMSAYTASLPAYLYASEAAFEGGVGDDGDNEEHTCDFGDWTDNGDGTHTGECECGETKTASHTYGGWANTEDGLVRTCTACDATETLAVNKPLDEVVVDKTDSATNDMGAALVLKSPVEIFNTVLTTEEQTSVAEGKTSVNVYLEVLDVPVDDVSAEEKAAAQEAVADERDTEIGKYLDISLFKEVTTEEAGETSTKETKITETNDKVTITIEIPEDLLNSDENVIRKYRIVRVHDDGSGNLETAIIGGTFDAEKGTFTFETDKFSTYVLAYSDNPSYVEIDLGEKAASSNVRYIEIDGVQTLIAEDDRIYKVISEGNKLVEVVEKASADSPVIVKSQYFYIAKDNASATKLNMDSFMTTDGKKSVRVENPMGIRFRASVLTSARSEETEFVIDEYGYIIALESALNGAELTFDFAKHVTGVAYNKADGTDYIYDVFDEGVIFTCALKNITVANYKKNLVCKTYTKLTVNGEQFTVYGESVTGNVYDTAMGLLSHGGLDEETKRKIYQIILDYDNEVGIPVDELYK